MRMEEKIMLAPLWFLYANIQVFEAATLQGYVTH
jgi:hypothetical protein